MTPLTGETWVARCEDENGDDYLAVIRIQRVRAGELVEGTDVSGTLMMGPMSDLVVKVPDLEIDT